MIGQTLLLLLLFVNFKQIQCDTTGMTTQFNSTPSTSTYLPTSMISNPTPVVTNNGSSNGANVSSTMVTNSSTYGPSSTQPTTTVTTMNQSPSATSMTSMVLSSSVTSPAQSGTGMTSMGLSSSVTSPVQSGTGMTSMGSSSSVTSPIQAATGMTTMASSSSVSSPMQSATSIMKMNSGSSGGSSVSYFTPISTTNSSASGTATVPSSASSNTAASSASTPQPTYNIYNLIYKFDISSLSPLMIGNFTNASVINSVQLMVSFSFNSTNFNVTVTLVEVKAPARTNNRYQLLTYNRFQTLNNNCNQICITNSASNSTPTQNLTLISSNGSLVSAVATLPPSLYISGPPATTTAAAVNYPRGESPPGVAAQLGMGLGISFIGIILIVEVVYLCRKYGSGGSNRQSEYELTSHHQRL